MYGVGSIAGWLAALGLYSVLSGCGEAETGSAAYSRMDRWYSPQQIAQGARLYVRDCADCHGGQGQGADDWRLPLADGAYPPPPLNGSGHTWQHSLTELQHIINQGGISLGGRMPPFVDKYDQDQVLALIAYFQSRWPEVRYRRWATQGGL